MERLSLTQSVIEHTLLEKGHKVTNPTGREDVLEVDDVLVKLTQQAEDYCTIQVGGGRIRKFSPGGFYLLLLEDLRTAKNLTNLERYYASDMEEATQHNWYVLDALNKEFAVDDPSIQVHPTPTGADIRLSFEAEDLRRVFKALTRLGIIKPRKD